MEGKDYKTDQNCFPLALLLSCYFLSLALWLSSYLSLSLCLSLSLLTDLQLCMLELRDLLLQENKHFIIIIWTQSVSYSVMMFVRKLPQHNKQFTYGQTVQKNNNNNLHMDRQCKKTTNNLHMDRQCKKKTTNNLHMDRQCKKTTIYIWTDSAKKQQTIYIWTDSAKKQQQFTYGQYIFTDCTEDNV